MNHVVAALGADDPRALVLAFRDPQGLQPIAERDAPAVGGLIGGGDR